MDLVARRAELSVKGLNRTRLASALYRALPEAAESEPLSPRRARVLTYIPNQWFKGMILAL